MFFEKIFLRTQPFHFQLVTWILVTWSQIAARKLTQLCIHLNVQGLWMVADSLLDPAVLYYLVTS